MENSRESGFGIYNQTKPILEEKHALQVGTHVTENISVLGHT